MFVFAAICIFAFVFLYVRGRKIDFPGKRKGILGVFDSAAAQSLLIAEKIKKGTRGKTCIYPGVISGGEVARNLSALNPGENKEEVYYSYVIRKMSLTILVFIAGCAVAILVGVSSKSAQKEDGRIKRDAAGGDVKEVSLYAETADGEFPVELTVFPRQMSRKETDELAEKIFEEIEGMILGENPSKDAVSEDLNLKIGEKIKPFKIEWFCSDPELISLLDGKTAKVKKDTSVVLTALLRYSDFLYERDIDITLVPKVLSAKEKARDELNEGLIGAERDSAEDEIFVLPEKIGDVKVAWHRKKDHTGIYLLAASLAVAILIYKMSDKDLKDKLENKKRLLKRAYPELLQMLALYTGAGLSVRNAFMKIAASGADTNSPVYDEMLLTCREIKSGRSEEEAYSEFGNRCGLQEYIRVSAYLGQSLKRGGTDLRERLREEISGAQTERIQNCRKLTEEASTKLLLPMVMMLVVVMVMILLPAFSNMDI